MQQNYGIQIRFIQDAQEEDTPKPRKSLSASKSGSYGVSIRVQGIDGQPYVVLNSNKEGQLQVYEPPTGNGSVDRTLVQDSFKAYPGPFGDYARELRTEKLSKGGDFPAHEIQCPSRHRPSLPPKLPAPPPEDPREEINKERIRTSNLLNFQKHPEILKPYDPEKSLFKPNGQPSGTGIGSKIATSIPPFAQRKESKPFHSLARSESSTRSDIDAASSARPSDDKSNVGKFAMLGNLAKKVPAPPGSKADVFDPSRRCQSNTGTDTEDSRRTRPDLLPLRRQDSAGRALEISRSRRSSSSTPTSVCSEKLLYKQRSEDADEELYAENVNRHENRRYIPFKAGTGRDIDTGSIPAVDELIGKFDEKDGQQQRRGRSVGRRNRIKPEDRKRSRSVDSALPFPLRCNSAYLDEHSKSRGKSTERLLRPSQLLRQNATSQDPSSPSPSEEQPVSSIGGSLDWPDTGPGEKQSNHSYGCMKNLSQAEMTGAANVQNTVKSSTLPVGTISKPDPEKKEVASITQIKTSTATLSFSGSSRNSGTHQSPASTNQTACDRDVQVTPDLLKDQQTNEETAKQILYNYLKEGSNDDDATKKKVNLVFEKIQTLKSRSAVAGGEPKDKKVDESSTEFKALLEQKNELEKKVVEVEKKVNELKKALEKEILNQQSTKEQKDRTKANLKNLEQEMEESLEENNRLRELLAKTDKELRSQLEELMQVKMEKEQYQSEIRDMQDQLSEMHDELDHAKITVASEEEKEILIMDLIQAKQELKDVLAAKEDQEEALKRRERELTALRGVLKEEVSNHDQEIENLKDKYEKEMQKQKKRLEDEVQNQSALKQGKDAAEQAKSTAEGHAKHLADENETLKRKVAQLQAEIAKLNQIISDMRKEESKLKDKVTRLETEKKQLEAALREIGDQKEDMSMAKRVLENRLEDVQRSLNKRSQEYHDLIERMKAEAGQKDLLKKTKNEMEDERRQLEKTIEKLQKEGSEMTRDFQRSTLELQKELDDWKERNRREVVDLQRQMKDKTLEAEKSRQATKKLQDEMHQLENELMDVRCERDEVVEKSLNLQQTVNELELDLESKKLFKEDRSRQVKQMEDKLAEMEMELDEERSNSDLLIDRISKGREQIEQMRNELLQERAARQDLECDKISLERQNKDIKSRIFYLEGSQKQSKEGIVTQLEGRIQELEERLEDEDRERASLQLANRKLERKVKDLMMQIDDEHLHLTDQKDQLSLRLKALKRQVDEAEEEIDRMENTKKKLQRELEEQREANEELQGQMNTLKKELRRKNLPAKAQTSLLNDLENDYSTDEESMFDSGLNQSKESHL
ncbi:cingulin-like protein 1 isoform X1 [Callorhinchus milii]|uniref:cingulin-like protein 1 isoform X1 n=1 Tax=Callorhinchus milii TaxID=7868 RepID=UPI001C3F953C|nr:cingulin-like protein 1 isoform X1 [Callorhinchus milii]XP_042200000.1 cingulin-like protein 1 isoform X1 [Callorhinchus milii]